MSSSLRNNTTNNNNKNNHNRNSRRSNNAANANDIDSIIIDTRHTNPKRHHGGSLDRDHSSNNEMQQNKDQNTTSGGGRANKSNQNNTSNGSANGSGSISQLFTATSSANAHPLVQTVQQVTMTAQQTSQNGDEKMSRIKNLMEQQKARQDYNLALAAASQSNNGSTSNGGAGNSQHAPIVSFLASDNLFSVNRKKQCSIKQQMMSVSSLTHHSDSHEINQTQQSINESNAQQHGNSSNHSKLENSNYISALLSRRNPDLLVPGPVSSFIKGNLYTKEQPPTNNNDQSLIDDDYQDGAHRQVINTDTYCSLEEEGQLPPSQQEPIHDHTKSSSPNKKTKKDSQQSMVQHNVGVTTQAATDQEESDLDQEEDAYQQLRKQGGSRYFQELNPTIRCRNCDEIGHMARECPNDRKRLNCILCGKNTHDSFQCTEKLCFKCNKIGHKATECTEQNIVKCQNCNAVGHRANRCLKFRPLVDDKQMKFARCMQCGKDGHVKCSQQRECEKIRIDFKVKDNLDEFLQERNHPLIGHENNDEDCQYAFDYIDRISKPKSPANAQQVSRRQKAKQRKQKQQRRGRLDKNSNLLLPDSDDEMRRNSFDYSSDEVDANLASQLYCCVCAGLHHVSACARQREGRYAQYDQVRQRLASQTAVTQGSSSNNGNNVNSNNNNYHGQRQQSQSRGGDNDHYRMEGREEQRKKHGNKQQRNNNYYNLRDDMHMKDPHSNNSANSRGSRWQNNRSADRYDDQDSSDSYTNTTHQNHHILNDEEDDDSQHIGKYNRRHKKDKRGGAHHNNNMQNQRNNHNHQQHHHVRFTHDSDDDDFGDHLEIQRRSQHQKKSNKHQQQSNNNNQNYHHHHHGRQRVVIDQGEKRGHSRSRSRDIRSQQQLMSNNNKKSQNNSQQNNSNSSNSNNNRGMSNSTRHHQNKQQHQNNNNYQKMNNDHNRGGSGGNGQQSQKNKNLNNVNNCNSSAQQQQNQNVQANPGHIKFTLNY